MIRAIRSIFRRIRKSHLDRHKQLQALQEEFYRSGATELGNSR